MEQTGTLERVYYRFIDRISLHICAAADIFVGRALEDEVVETYKMELQKKGKDNESIKERIKKKEIKTYQVCRFGCCIQYGLVKVFVRLKI